VTTARSAPPEADAGNETDASTMIRVCRVRKRGDGYVASCEDETNGLGTDGATCTEGADCAPGFDCIAGDKGGTCRRYCCSGSCAAQTAHNGGPTFCDIRKLVDFTEHLVPVCLPLKTCKLLQAGQCGDTETCAVVTEKGDTGCVEIGNANVGDSCESQHCAAGLTCFGSPGDRRCYKLCKVDGADCGPTQKCTTGAVFQDTTFGVCNDD